MTTGKQVGSAEAAAQGRAQPSAPVRPDNRPLALIAVNCFAFCAILTQVCSKLAAERGCPLPDFALLTAVFRMIVNGGIMHWQGKHMWRDLPTGAGLFIAIRAICNIVIIYGVLYSVRLIPIAISNIILKSSPFWTGLLSMCLNNEPFTRMDLIAMILCFGFIVGITFTGKSEDLNTNTDYVFVIGVCIAFICSWSIGISNVVTRRLKAVQPTVIVQWITTTLFLFSAVASPITFAINRTEG